MDIDLLAKMVKEVIVDHDSVTLPGVGSFVTEVVPASFTDKGYTIHPPYRRLFFSPKQGEDALLAGLYARSNDISEEDATRILVEFLAEMKEVLKVRKTIVFPGLGRLRATRENHFFFVADEDLDIYPAGFGLESISLKTHEETREEVEEAVSNLAGMLETPAPEPVTEETVADASPVAEENADAPSEAPAPVVEPAPVIPGSDRESPETDELPELVTVIDTPEPEPAPVAVEPEAEASPAPEEKAVKSEPAVEPEPEPVKRSRFWRILLIIAIVIVVAIIILAVLGRVAPEWLDKFLYSEEELRILHG